MRVANPELIALEFSNGKYMALLQSSIFTSF